MNLLTNAIYPVAVILVLVAVVGGAWLTSRTRRGWGGTLLNGLVILLASLLVTLGVGLVLNRQNGWYPTLQDLLPAPSDSAGKVYGAHPEASPNADVTRRDDRSIINEIFIPKQDAKTEPDD